MDWSEKTRGVCFEWRLKEVRGISYVESGTAYQAEGTAMTKVLEMNE